MIGNAFNGFIVLMLGASGSGTTGDCQPYTKPSHLAADLVFSTQLERVSHLAADGHLCEQMQ